MKRVTFLYKKETGLVSIVVTVVIMFVLSITVMSFAAIMRREQRQVLDRQLNTQAFYAAESGINDAIARIKEIALSNPTLLQTSYTTNCNGFANALAGIGKPLQSSVKSGDSNVAYSCLLVDPRPESLEYKSVDRNPIVVPITSAVTGQLIDTITLNWQAADGTPGFNCAGGAGGPPNLPPDSQWGCPTGLIRADLVKTPPSFSRDDLNSSLRTVFLFPKSGGSGNYTLDSNTGKIVEASCVSPPAVPGTKYCTANISVTPAQSYYMKMNSIYKTSSVTITAKSGASNVELIGSQIMIDSTGRANDILRRIQVRVAIDLLGEGPFPLGAIQSANTICKQFSVVPPSIIDHPVDTNCDLN